MTAKPDLVEARLRASESRLRAILDTEPECVKTVSPEGRVLEMNPAGLRMIEADSAAEVLGREILGLVHREDRAAYLELHRRAAGGGSGQVQFRIVGLKGTVRWMETHSVPLRAEDASVLSVLSVTRDISERKRAEADLRASEDRYRDLVENSQDLMCTQDLEGNLLSANEAAIRLTGYTREALLQMNVADLLAPEVRSRFAEHLRALLALGRASGLMRIRTATGETRYWEFNNTLRTEGVFSPVIRGMARDVTEARRAAAALRQSEAKYRALIECMADGLLLTDRDEIIRFANLRACRMLGYSEAELLGQNATDLLFREEDKAAMATRNLRRSEGIAEGYEIEVRKRSGELLWTSFSVAPMTDEDGRITGSMAIVADITERKRVEALSDGQKQVLKMIGGGAPLAETLGELVRVLEVQAPEMLISVLLLDGDGVHLRHGAAPSLPADYIRAIDGLAIGPCAGSCGTAAFRREAVIVEDIATDPLWEERRALALHSGLRACWSSPIFDARKQLLGTFAIYYRQPCRPTEQHLRLVDIATQTAAIAIADEQGRAALRRSETQLRSFIELAPADMAMFDNDMICLAASQRWISAYARGCPTPVGRSHYEVNPDLPERWKEIHQRGLEGESMACDEDLWVQADGTHQWLRWSMEPWRDAQGAIGGIVLLVEDISARKQAEAAILTEKSFSEAMLDSLPGVFYLFDQTGRFLRWNRALEAVSEYSATEIAAMSPLDFFTGEDMERIAETVRKVFERGHAEVEAALISKSGGEIPHYFVGTRISWNGAPCCIGTGLDISARKLLETELRQSQKIEAIGRLAGGVAHDFNNILGVILGYLELAHSELEPESPVREYVAETVEAAQRAVTLTRQLQAFSRKQVLQPRRLDLNGLVAAAHKMLDRVIGEDIALVVRAAAELGTVFADPGQIDQILLNLAINARDAMPKGGALTLETANIDLREEAPASDRPAIVPGRYVMIAVSDTGVGMDAETQRRLFEPFFTTKPVGQGTGLGLATVYGIVKQSGGYIWVYSEPGLGTTFKIYLPRIDDLPDGAPTGDLLAIPGGGSETILLVEDNPALREMMRRRLAGRGYTVLMAADGEEALALEGARGEPIDLLLTDVVMPNLGGAELARRLGERRPGLPVLFMSGYTDGAIVQHGVLEEGVVLLEKPFSGEKLLRAVRVALDRPDAKGFPSESGWRP